MKTKQGVTTNPKAVADICASLAFGETGVDIAKRYNVAPQQISKVSGKHREEIHAIKQRIQNKVTTELLEDSFDIAKQEIAIDKAVTNDIAQVVEDKGVVSSAKLELKKAFKNTKDEVLKTSGAIVPNINNQTIHNQYNQQNNTKIDANVFEWLVRGEIFEPIAMNEIDDNG
jgi:hypothetical protein